MEILLQRRVIMNPMENAPHLAPTAVAIPIHGLRLRGDLVVPPAAQGIVVFAHGSGSGRDSPRNHYVAHELHAAGFATLLFDLLTPTEAVEDARSGYWRFEIPLLAHRLEQTSDWLETLPETRKLPLGFFGSSTGAAAALVAAAHLDARVRAVVSRGGRADFATDVLGDVVAATLLIVGQLDEGVLHLNRRAFERLRCARELAVIPGATHLFEEAGAIEKVAELTTAWFRAHLSNQEAT